MDLTNFERYCSICGNKLLVIKKKQVDRPILFQCMFCKRYYKIKFALIEVFSIDE